MSDKVQALLSEMKQHPLLEIEPMPAEVSGRGSVQELVAEKSKVSSRFGSEKVPFAELPDSMTSLIPRSFRIQTPSLERHFNLLNAELMEIQHVFAPALVNYVTVSAPLDGAVRRVDSKGRPMLNGSPASLLKMGEHMLNMLFVCKKLNLAHADRYIQRVRELIDDLKRDILRLEVKRKALLHFGYAETSTMMFAGLDLYGHQTYVRPGDPYVMKSTFLGGASKAVLTVAAGGELNVGSLLDSAGEGCDPKAPDLIQNDQWMHGEVGDGSVTRRVCGYGRFSSGPIARHHYFGRGDAEPVNISAGENGCLLVPTGGQMFLSGNGVSRLSTLAAGGLSVFMLPNTGGYQVANLTPRASLLSIAK